MTETSKYVEMSPVKVQMAILIKLLEQNNTWCV